MGRACLAQACPVASQDRRFSQSPIDALIDLVVWSGLRRQIPVRLDLRTLFHLRVTAGIMS